MKKLSFVLIFSLLCSRAAAQVSDPENPDLDPNNYQVENIYFHVGTYYGLSQPVATDLKKISISGPMDHDVAKTYEAIFKEAIERRGLKQYLENDFLVTDLFPESYTHGKSVFIVYKYDDVIEEYLALKERKKELMVAGNYSGAARHALAASFGQFLSYTDERIEEYIGRNGTNN